MSGALPTKVKTIKEPALSFNANETSVRDTNNKHVRHVCLDIHPSTSTIPQYSYEDWSSSSDEDIDVGAKKLRLQLRVLELECKRNARGMRSESHRSVQPDPTSPILASPASCAPNWSHLPRCKRQRRPLYTVWGY